MLTVILRDSPLAVVPMKTVSLLSCVTAGIVAADGWDAAAVPVAGVPSVI